jgi:pyrroline-5-carboxylate reductase
MVHASVIGCGHMGSAVVRGLADAGGHSITAYDVDERALEEVADDSDRTTGDLDVAAAADVVFVAVPPDALEAVVEELDLRSDQTLISLAAGVPRAVIADRTAATVLRVMPNLAAEHGAMAAAVAGPELDDGVRELLADLGEFVVIDESEMDVATALNGSGPAFVFYVIQALRDAGIERGLDPDAAETLAAQTVRGAAEIVLESEASIEDLIDDVCTPGGTTIEGMEVLWDSDLAGDLAAAVDAAAERSAELAREVDDE